jgi:hypothetical protein
MLQQVLRELETAQGPVNLSQLARKLKVDPGALEGMVQFWVRKGRLKNLAAADETAPLPSCSGCTGSCPGPAVCPFIVALPRSYALTAPRQTE